MLSRTITLVAVTLIALISVATIGQTVGTQSVGDTDCNQQVNAVDALRILRHSAGLPNTTFDDCGAIGNQPASVYWVDDRGAAIYIYSPNLSCQQTGFTEFQVHCTNPVEGWGLDCTTSGNTLACVHSQDGAFNCADSSTLGTVCNGSVWSGGCGNEVSGTVQCQRTDGFGVRTANCVWSGYTASCTFQAASFDCTRSDGNGVLLWTCSGP